MFKTLIFAYDRAAVSAIEKQIKIFIRSNIHISQWSELFPGVFILKTYSEISELNDLLYEFMNKNYYVLAAIDPDFKSTNGSLPKEVWKWIKTKDQKSLTVSVVQE